MYLDAVFFSRLDPLDFAQEGHRVEFENDDRDQPLTFKGVVFNEMKGAMSSTPSVLWDRLCYELFPSNTYHFNSGGDPEAIPDLTYQQLRDFYAEHYHPSNAIFLTFGDIPAADHQRVFESAVLDRFDALDRKVEVALEAAFTEPRSATHTYAIDPEEDIQNKTHLIMGWKLGESADLTAMLEAQLVASVLMENSASPLMHYLETTALGTAPSPLCGLEESMREMVFCCGIEGSDISHAAAFESAVLDCIQQRRRARYCCRKSRGHTEADRASPARGRRRRHALWIKSDVTRLRGSHSLWRCRLGVRLGASHCHAQRASCVSRLHSHAVAPLICSRTPTGCA